MPIKNVWKKIISWPLKTKIMACSGVLLLVAGAISGAVIASNYKKPTKDVATKPVKESIETPVVVETESGEIVVMLPEYLPLGIATDSVEKDLNVYFTDETDAAISGSTFAVKLTSKEEASKLTDILSYIGGLNTQLAEQTLENSNTVEVPESIDVKDYMGGLTEEEFESLTKEEQLGIQKDEAIKSYTTLVEGLEGSTYEDEDNDGLIYQTDMEAGDFVLCYIPTDNYDPSSYVQDVTIKDKIEYKEMKNIEKKVKKYNASEDTNQNATTVESKKKDTLTYVASDTKDIAAVYSTTTAVIPQASTGAIVTKALEEVIVPAASPTIDRHASTGCSVSVEGSATLHSKISNTLNLTLNLAGGTFTSVTTKSNNTNVTVSESSSSDTCKVFSITAADVQNDTSATITFDVEAVDGDEKSGTATLSCEVSVKGYQTKIVDANGKEVFGDANGKTAITYSNCASYATVYYKSAEAYTQYFGWQTLDGTRYYFDSTGTKVTGTQVIQGQQYTFGTDGALLTSGYGIDVSKHQGNIDWSKVKSVASFAIIRANYRGQTDHQLYSDPKAVANTQGALANNIKIGFYVYSTAQNTTQAVEEASALIAFANKYAAGRVSLPLYIDMEDASQQWMTTQQRNEIVMAFCNTVRASGYTAGVYANKNWLTNYLTPSSYPGWVSIWYARYYKEPGYNGRYDIWQYRSDGSVPGINGNVDMNISYF